MIKLTKEETAWIKKVQKVLDECPSERIGAFTIGDRDVMLYDRSRDADVYKVLDAEDIDFCKAVDRAKASMGSLLFPFEVHSTAG